MERVQQDRDREQEEEWVKAAAGAVGVVLRQDRVDIVSAPPAVKKQPINWEALVMIRNALSVERL